MRLDEYLKEHHGYTRSRAQLLIADGSVCINGIQAAKASKTVMPADVVTVTDSIKYVSRAGLKLEKALAVFDVSPDGKDCLDVGSSTGGFTDCLLRNQASHVTCVDVGTDQLHESIRNDTRVTVHEKTDIRNFEPHKTFGLIVCDASFISLRAILPAIGRLCRTGTQIILLIKPQFEVGRDFLNKQGIVTDLNRADEAIVDVVNEARACDLRLMSDIVGSPIQGGDGNNEYLAYFTYSK